MNYKVKISTGLEYCIVGLVALLFFMIWPTNMIHDTYVSKSDEVVAEESGAISVEYNATQMFISEGDYLQSVNLFICNEMQGQLMTFRVYDGEYKQLFETFYTVPEKAQLPGFVNIPIEMEMVDGWAYYYTMEGLTQDLIVNYEDLYTSGSFANGTLTYGGEEVLERNIIIRYNYTSPFPWWKVLLSGIVLAVIAVGLIYVLRNQVKSAWKEKEVSTQHIIRWIANPLITVGLLITLLAIFPGKKFGFGWFNYGFYYLGTCILAGLCYYAVNAKRSTTAPLIVWNDARKNIPHILQSMCFAGCLWSCYEYMNGLYDIHHSYATCKLLVWFGLGMIVTYTKKELLNWWNLVYVVGASIGAYFYAKPYVGVEEQEELYRLQAYVLVVIGFILINVMTIIVRLLLKAIKKQGEAIGTRVNWIYGIGTIALVSCLIVFRNTREWPILIAGMFGVFYFRMWAWKDRSHLLENFCNGILMNFGVAMIYCFIHRPYQRYYYYRYGMMFHTVTITGVYLTLVVAAALVKWLIAYEQKGVWKETWKELSLLATATIYLLFTLSRTGFAGVAGMGIFVIVTVAICSKENNRFAVFGKRILLWVLATLLLFPAVFTAVRILPSVADDPVISEVEEKDTNIEKGYPTNGEYYMDFPRYLDVTGYKIFAVTKDTARIAIDRAEVLVASTEDVAIQTEETKMETEEDEHDFTNGRLDIFAAYLANLNLTGHEGMGLLIESGETLIHAHNSYIQVMYDHGIPTAIVFIIFGISTLIVGIIRFVKRKNNTGYELLTVAVIVGFAVVALVEWVFHPCNPFGFALFVVVAPLLFVEQGENLKENVDGEKIIK